MITIQRLEDTIKFTFDNNPLYLHDGTIEVPVNSLSLLIDESNIATFKKADSLDIFLSTSLDELNMTKEELLTWYAENATGGGSIDPEEVEEIVEEATENLFGYAEYDSQSTRINFKHDASGDVITYIDASDFVIDGMIDNVEVVTVQGVKYLKITFNTESGKEPILIPLSDIFNPNEYYTKTEVDNALSGKQDTLIAGTNITISGNVISAEGGGSSYTAGSGIDITNDVISVTGKVDVDVFEEKERVVAASLVDLNERKLDASAYTPTDLSNYYTKAETDNEISAGVSGKANVDDVYTKTEVDSALSGKQDTLIAGTNITIVDNVISAEGGGKAVSGGTNISITTGETADTINCTLPITILTSNPTSVIIGNDNNKSYINNANYSFAEGAKGGIGDASHNSHKEGYYSTIGNYAMASHVEGYYCSVGVNSKYSHSEGYYTKTTNESEHSSGRYNVSNKANTTFGNSGNTLFSVGNGTADNARHNAFEIRQNGDIYIVKDGQDIKLQDQLGGGGGGGISSAECQTMIDNSISGKVDTSAVTSSVTSGSTDVVTSGGVYEQLGGMKILKMTESEYTALVNKDNSTLYVVIPDSN